MPQQQQSKVPFAKTIAKTAAKAAPKKTTPKAVKAKSPKKLKSETMPGMDD